jgi:hypothetical protein
VLKEETAVEIADADQPVLLHHGNAPQCLRPMFEAASKTGVFGDIISGLGLLMSSTFVPNTSGESPPPSP